MTLAGACAPVPPGEPPTEPEAIESLTVGGHHACALSNEGTVRCWGWNYGGEIGDNWPSGGTGFASTTAVTVDGIGTAVSIDAGYNHTCAANDAGAVYCWGSNNYGELGDYPTGVGSNVVAPTPRPVVGVTDAVQVATSESHTCALRSGGSVSCWGRNTNGELGNGQFVDSKTPVDVSGAWSDAFDIDVSTAHSCVVRSGGVVSCWGRNLEHSLATYGPQWAVPLDVDLAEPATGISMGDDHVCVDLDAYRVQCWGANDLGQRAEPAPTTVLPSTSTPMPENWTHVAAGDDSTCGVAVGGALECWGSTPWPGATPLGESTTVPTAIPVAGTVLRSAHSDGQICVLRSNREVACSWGAGDGFIVPERQWEVIVGLPMNGGVTNAPTLPQMQGLHSISAGQNHTCGLADSGRLMCWGTNGQVRHIPTEEGLGFFAHIETDIDDAVAVDLGTSTGCVVHATGAVSCFGSNNWGEGGPGPPRPFPVVIEGVSNAVDISVGKRHTCALLSDTTLSCWGRNVFGRDTNGSSVTSPPTPVPDLVGVVEVEALHETTCVRLVDTTVSCFGALYPWQVAPGAPDNRSSVPVAVEGLSGVADLADVEGGCAVLNSGHVSCWADGPPSNVPGISDAIAITGGISVNLGTLTTCVIRSGGTVSCWGLNNSGQVGDGTTIDAPSPVDIAVADAADISAGEGIACARHIDTTAKCWGSNQQGALGNPSVYESLVPIEVTTMPEGFMTPG